MKLLLFILFLFCMPLQAHQPKLINYSPTIDNPHAVIFPEISKAYYSKLTGQPHYYVINSEDDFLFYTSILSPKINEEPSRFSLEVLDGDQNIVYKVDGSNFDWTAWYAPSGTALMLGEAAAKGRDVSLEDVKDLDRTNVRAKRNHGNIGLTALRGGDVVGEHSVIFAGFGERIVISHIANNREIFARGALKAAQWTLNKEPKLYSMLDVLGI